MSTHQGSPNAGRAHPRLWLRVMWSGSGRGPIFPMSRSFCSAALMAGKAVDMK